MEISTGREDTALFTHLRKTLYFQVGIDFGTSSTKIAYSQIGGRVKNVRPILFNHNLSHYPEYCLPSLAAFDSSKRLIFGIGAASYLADKPWDLGLRRLKVIVAGKYDRNFFDCDTVKTCSNYLGRIFGDFYEYYPECVTAMFLAYAMHISRLTIQKEFPDHDLDLAFNICIPIDHLQNNKVHRIFQKICLMAEKLESNWQDNNLNMSSLEDVAYMYMTSHSKTDDQNEHVFVIPESVAEMASYLVSLQVQDGLHAVIDFGAGTTDVSIFNLCESRTPEATLYWYSARNVPRGSQRIERIVMNYLLKNSGNNYVTEAEVALAVNILYKSSEQLKNEVKEELYQLWENTHCAWQEAYRHKKKQSEWEKDKVQIFICGGGSKAPFVTDIFQKSWMDNWGPYPIKKLPIPDDYDSMNGRVPFERLSVAYGLTISLPELGNFVLPLDSPDHTPPRLPIREFLPWDERRPNRNWLGT